MPVAALWKWTHCRSSTARSVGQALPIQIVRANPDTLAEFGEVQRRCGPAAQAGRLPIGRSSETTANSHVPVPRWRSIIADAGCVVYALAPVEQAPASA